jgi:hypothetical protein
MMTLGSNGASSRASPPRREIERRASVYEEAPGFRLDSRHRRVASIEREREKERRSRMSGEVKTKERVPSRRLNVGWRVAA